MAGGDVVLQRMLWPLCLCANGGARQDQTTSMLNSSSECSWRSQESLSESLEACSSICMGTESASGMMELNWPDRGRPSRRRRRRRRTRRQRGSPRRATRAGSWWGTRRCCSRRWRSAWSSPRHRRRRRCRSRRCRGCCCSPPPRPLPLTGQQQSPPAPTRGARRWAGTGCAASSCRSRCAPARRTPGTGSPCPPCRTRSPSAPARRRVAPLLG